MFKIGDKVKIKNHPNEVTGKIVRRIYSGSLWGVNDYKYLVEFDDEKLIPPSMEYEADHMILLEAYINKYGRDCECGAKHDRHFPDVHSFYCPKRGK